MGRLLTGAPSGFLQDLHVDTVGLDKYFGQAAVVHVAMIHISFVVK